MRHKLPPLPYEENALEPFMSARTLSFHYGKHHQTYLDNLNKLIEGTEFENMTLEQIIQESYKNPQQGGIFNNAAQVWNHSFFWNSLSPTGNKRPSPPFLNVIEKSFGSYENFSQEFKKTALSQFGSGWCWLVKEGNTLKIIKTSNADTPLVLGKKPLLTCDVWEHAYYLDYQNKRADYLDTFLTSLINWNFAENNFQDE